LNFPSCEQFTKGIIIILRHFSSQNAMARSRKGIQRVNCNLKYHLFFSQKGIRAEWWGARVTMHLKSFLEYMTLTTYCFPRFENIVNANY